MPAKWSFVVCCNLINLCSGVGDLQSHQQLNRQEITTFIKTTSTDLYLKVKTTIDAPFEIIVIADIVFIIGGNSTCFAA